MSKTKIMLDTTIEHCRHLSKDYFILECIIGENVQMPAIAPGQFAELRVDGTNKVFLRRPISIAYFDDRTIHFLIRIAGDGTQQLSTLKRGDTLNIVFPLGSSFTLPLANEKALLVGGGVGIAPMYALARELNTINCTPDILIGAKSASDLLLIKELSCYGTVACTTDDGSCGEKGLVTNHSIFKTIEQYDVIYSCGPEPMMRAIVAISKKHNIRCQVSLENKMACGIGVCLCCVEDTIHGNTCVCTEGPVFDAKLLKW